MPNSSAIESIVMTALENTHVKGNAHIQQIGQVLQQHVQKFITNRFNVREAQFHQAEIHNLFLNNKAKLNIRNMDTKTLAEQIAKNLNEQSEQLRALAKQEQMQQLIDSIKEKYRKENILPNVLEGPTLTLMEGCYINLASIKSDEQIAKEQKLKQQQHQQQSKPDSESTSNHTQRDNRLSSFEDIHRPKDPLPLNKLFVRQSDKTTDTTADKLIQRVLMLGRAGIGKSTLCQYLAYRWADETKTKEEAWLESYDVLLWIKLRELISLHESLKAQHKRCGVADVVTISCVFGLDSSNEVFLTQAVNELIHDSTKTILWVLDGFDEVAHLYGNAQHPLHTVLHELFPRATTPDPLHQVLLTSRPYATQGLQVDRTIENIGLLDDDIPRYVTQYFNKLSKPNPDLGKKVATQIKANPNIHGMAHVPINAYLICHLYQKESSSQQEDTSLKSVTLTQLYQRLVVDLCRRMVNQPRHTENLSDEQKEELLEDYPEDIIERYRPSLWVLAHLAFQGLTDNNTGLTLDWSLQEQVLRSLQMKIVDYKKAILPLGLLKTVCETSEDTTKAPRYFMHLTFQEFFAALYLVWSLAEYGQATSKHKDQALNFLKNDKYTPRYQVIFWFAAGLVRHATWFNNDDTIQQTALTNLWDKGFLSNPQDITGLGQFHLLAHAFEEGGEPTSISTSSQDNPINTAWTFIKDTINKTLNDKISDTKNSRLFEPLFATLAECPHLSNDHAQALVKFLQDDNKDVRQRALYAIKALKVTHTNIPKKIAQGLSNDDWKIRQSALDALIKLNVSDPNILQKIAQDLSNDHWNVRRSALNALAKLNVSDPYTLQQIAQCLSDDHEDVRLSALITLRELNVSDTHILQRIAQDLSDDDWLVRRSALCALAKLNVSDTSIFQKISEYLQHDNEDVRRSALDALAKLNVSDPNILQKIAQCLSDNDWHVRKSALDALKALNVSDTNILQQIALCLSDDDWHVRQCALNALAMLNISDTRTLQQIAKHLSDDDGLVRQCALNALAKLNVSDTNILQRIALCLSDNDWHVRQCALNALAMLNISDTRILQQIALRLSDDNWHVRRSAFWAMKNLNISDTHFLQKIAECLQHDNEDVRQSALVALAKLNVSDTRILQQIALRLSDDQEDVSQCTLDALAKPNVSDTHILQQITEYLQHDNWYVRQSALDVLVKLKVSNTHILQQIVLRLSDDDELVRQCVLNALTKLNVSDAHIIQQITEYLQHDNKDVRQCALNALAMLNVSDIRVLQQIALRLSDGHEDVRRCAVDTLAKLNVSDTHILQQIALRLSDDDGLVRRSALEAMVRLNVPDTHLLQQITLRLSDNHENVRQCALNALAKLYVSDTHILQKITLRLFDDHEDVRRSAVDTLVRLNVSDTHILRQIALRLSDDHEDIRQCTLDALVKLNVSDTLILQQIVLRLSDNNELIRQSVVKTLNRLQPHLTIESWLPVWDIRIPNDSKRALSATTVQCLMTTWVKEHLYDESNSPLASNTSLIKIGHLFAKWIFDWLQLPLIIDENQRTFNIITTESADKLSITFPHHPLGQTAFKRCQQALTLQALIHPIVPFSEHTHLYTHFLNPEYQLNALWLSLKDCLDTNEDFDFNYVLHNIFHTYAAIVKQKPQLRLSTLDLVLTHLETLLTKHPHHIYQTTSIQNLLKKCYWNVDDYLSIGYEYYKKAQLDKAIFRHEQAVMVDPNNSRPYQNLACFYHIKSHSTPDEAPRYCKLAEHSFNQVLKLRPTPEIYAEYGQFLYLQQHYEKALPLFTQAIATTNDLVNTNICYSLMELSILDATLQTWLQNHKILKINSAHLAYYLIYRCYEALGQSQQQSTWLTRWAKWLASLPGEHPLSQHLLTTYQNKQATTALYTKARSDTTETNDEELATHVQTQPLLILSTTPSNTPHTTQLKQITNKISSVNDNSNEKPQKIFTQTLKSPTKKLNTHSLPHSTLPPTKRFKSSSEDSNIYQAYTQSANTPNSSP